MSVLQPTRPTWPPTIPGSSGQFAHLQLQRFTCLCCRYVNTTAVKSCISFIDGDKGILRYRGYPIEQLAEHSSFLEVGCALRPPLHALACGASSTGGTGEGCSRSACQVL